MALATDVHLAEEMAKFRSSIRHSNNDNDDDDDDDDKCRLRCTLATHRRHVRAWIISSPHNSRPWPDAAVTADCVVSKRCASSVHETVCAGKVLQFVLQNCTARSDKISWELGGWHLDLGGREEVTADWRTLPDMEVHVLFSWPNSYHVRDIKRTEMVVACGAERGEGKCIKGFVGSAWKESDNLEDLSVDGSVIIVFCCVRRFVSEIVIVENYKEAICFRRDTACVYSISNRMYTRGSQ